MSFGAMGARQGLLVRAESGDGAIGWGEVWVNYPAWAVEERMVILERAIFPALLGKDASDPEGAVEAVRRALAGPCRQAGTAGALWHAVSGVETALWDLLGRARGEPVWRLLSGAASPSHPAFPGYASGIDPARAAETVAAKRSEGFRGFKVKIGIDRTDDGAALRAARREAGDGTPLMADANGRFTAEEAVGQANRLRDLGLAWFEEPVWGDDVDALARVRSASSIPVAAGENLFGEAAHRRAVERRAVSILQPDVTKTGGLASARRACLAAKAAGLAYAPHFFGNAIGLAATLHLLASLPDRAWLECDVNPNPLREALPGRAWAFRDGALAVPEGPGLGVEPDPGALARFRA